jgi:hypothetical protein
MCKVAHGFNDAPLHDMLSSIGEIKLMSHLLVFLLLGFISLSIHDIDYVIKGYINGLAACSSLISVLDLAQTFLIQPHVLGALIACYITSIVFSRYGMISFVVVQITGSLLWFGLVSFVHHTSYVFFFFLSPLFVRKCLA